MKPNYYYRKITTQIPLKAKLYLKKARNLLVAYETEHLLVGLGFLVEGQGIGPGG